MKEKLPPLQGLYYFYKAAELGSFKVAANRLFVSAAAVSQQIRQLEESLGCHLFYRQHRKVLLTPEGQQLYRELAKGFEHIFTGVQSVNQDPNPIVCPSRHCHHLLSTGWCREYKAFVSKTLILRF